MSLRVRLVAAVAVVALVALVAADFAVYSALRSSLLSHTNQSLEQTAAALPIDRFDIAHRVPVPGSKAGVPVSEGATEPPAAAPPGGAAGVHQGPAPLSPGDQRRFVVTHAPGFSFELRSAGGKVLIGPFPGYQQGGVAYSPAVPRRITGWSAPSATAERQVFFTTDATTAGGPQFQVLAIKRTNGSVLVLGRTLTDVTNTLNDLLLIEVIVTACALAAAVALGWWLVRLGLRPLAAVENTAERIAAGGTLGHRVPGENDRTEVGRLARTVNVMLSRIEGAFAQQAATEAALRRSEEQLRQFVADASHELRTPLAAVGAYAELFERGAGQRPEDLERVMHGIRHEAARMGQLVEDLLLLARLDEGLPLERVPVELVAVAGDAVRTALTVGPAWPVSLEATEPVEVLGDEHRLRQVLDNLLANVRAHTPEGTTAMVRVRPADDEVVIEVADRGPGVRAEQAARMFERFYRIDPSRSRAHGGTGLGLSIVAAIVAAHGGRVAAAARAGGGTVVTLWLPRHRAPDEPVVPPEEPGAREETRSGHGDDAAGRSGGSERAQPALA